MSYTNKRGFALIEVLISMVILGFALNGVGQFWNKTVREGEHNYARNQAVIIARNVIQSVRANPQALATYQEETNWTKNTKALGVNSGTCVSPSATPVKCPPVNMALSDIFILREYARTSLPLNQGKVVLKTTCALGSSISCVIVHWGATANADACEPLNDGSGALETDRIERASGNEFNATSQCVVVDFI